MLKAGTKLGVLALVLVIFSSNTYAEESYFSIGGGAFELSDEDISDDASLLALTGRLGTNFNEYFSGEVRLGFGVGDDSVSVPLLGNVDIELDSMYGAYLRSGLPVSDSLFLYGVLGYTRSEITVSVPGFGSGSDSESDLSYGVGIDIDLSRNYLLNIEYMNYLDKGAVEITGFTVGFAKRF
jgi:opacity protein-like surface antigen